MKTIKLSEVEQEMKDIKKVLEGHSRMDNTIHSELEKMGYEYKELGTGKSALTHSMEIKVMDIKSDFYLNGKFLVVGCYNTAWGKGQMYRGYAKKVIEG